MWFANNEVMDLYCNFSNRKIDESDIRTADLRKTFKYFRMCSSMSPVKGFMV
jgi:hypothetical protein